MTHSYRLVTKTTEGVETALEALNEVLAMEFAHHDIRWFWREVSTTQQINRNAVHGKTFGHNAVAVEHEKYIKIKGLTRRQEAVTAIVKFSGFTHETEEDDFSEPLEIESIEVEIILDPLSARMPKRQWRCVYGPDFNPEDGWYRRA